MKGLSILAAAAGLLSVGTKAIQLVRRDAVPAVVGFDIQRRHVANPLARDRLRRRATSNTVGLALDNGETLYLANVSLGTPAQKLSLHIDTGSSDLWANSPKSQICKSKGSPCAGVGTYTANSSSTYKYVSSDFNISYVDGSGSTGDYATDTLAIGGATLTDLQFGIGYVSALQEGVLGLGYGVNEVQANQNNKQPYPNVPQLMANQGIIQSNAYSLWLNDLDASQGSILFGGVDSDKYQGELQTLPIIAEDGVFAEFIITLTALGLSSGGSSSQSIASKESIPVLLDSGSSLTYLPDAIASNIFSAVGAQYDQQSQAAYVPCSLMNNDTTLDFTFTTPSISVAMSELVIDPGTNPDGSAVTFNDGTPACLFGISSAGQSTNILGDTFLRSAYVVYDLSNNQISLAATDFNATSSNILEIGTGTSGVPSASGVAGAATSLASGGGSGRIGTPTGSGTVTGSGATATATGKSKSAASLVTVSFGLVAGVAVAGIMLIL
ncbi:MAG: hypothetical protein M1827_005720 [Pycnora praestabilis]|nr:MAG: hypothetical protein M1827_005720 [Pycnora praestabilis]